MIKHASTWHETTPILWNTFGQSYFGRKCPTEAPPISRSLQGVKSISHTCCITQCTSSPHISESSCMLTVLDGHLTTSMGKDMISVPDTLLSSSSLVSCLVSSVCFLRYMGRLHRLYHTTYPYSYVTVHCLRPLVRESSIRDSKGSIRVYNLGGVFHTSKILLCPGTALGARNCFKGHASNNSSTSNGVPSITHDSISLSSDNIDTGKIGPHGEALILAACKGKMEKLGNLAAFKISREMSSNKEGDNTNPTKCSFSVAIQILFLSLPKNEKNLLICEASLSEQVREPAFSALNGVDKKAAVNRIAMGILARIITSASMNSFEYFLSIGMKNDRNSKIRQDKEEATKKEDMLFSSATAVVHWSYRVPSDKGVISNNSDNNSVITGANATSHHHNRGVYKQDNATLQAPSDRPSPSQVSARINNAPASSIVSPLAMTCAKSSGASASNSTESLSQVSHAMSVALLIWLAVSEYVPMSPEKIDVQHVYGQIAQLRIDIDKMVIIGGEEGIGRLSRIGDASISTAQHTPCGTPLRVITRQLFGRFIDVLHKLRPYGCFVSSNGLLCTKARPLEYNVKDNEFVEAELLALEKVKSEGSSDIVPNCRQKTQRDEGRLRRLKELMAQARQISENFSKFSEVELNMCLEPTHTYHQRQIAAKQEELSLLTAAPHGWEHENCGDFYQPTLTEGPPPPLLIDDTSLTSQANRHLIKNAMRDGRSEFAGVFTPQMLVPIIPSYFVPVSQVLEKLPPGYTEEHIHGLFSRTGTIELIKLGSTVDDAFVRLHGGQRKVNMMRPGALDNTFDANHIPSYLPYLPDPSICSYFENVMSKNGVKPWQWISLQVLLTQMSDPDIVAKLPYKRYKALLFFAQMQHRFCFSPDEGGKVCRVSPDGMTGVNLTVDTSPLPTVCNELQTILLHHKDGVSIDTLIRDCPDISAEEWREKTRELTGESVSDMDIASRVTGLSPYSRDLLLQYFDGSILNFIKSHQEIFSMGSDGMLCNTVVKRKKEAKSLSLDVQLQQAIQSGGKLAAKKIRRKLAKERDPNNPFFDPDRLAEELARFLPKRQSISLRSFMRSLPVELLDVMPVKTMSLFNQRPKLFKIFEYKEPGRIHIIRPSLPLPEGHLRLSYTEPELLHLIAATLQGQQRRSIYDAFGRLPWFARETIRLHHKGLFEVVKKYPQYFTVVFQEAMNMDSRSASLILVASPPQVVEDNYNKEDFSDSRQQSSPVRNNGSYVDNTAIDEIRQSMASAGYTFANSSNEEMVDLDLD